MVSCSQFQGSSQSSSATRELCMTVLHALGFHVHKSTPTTFCILLHNTLSYLQPYLQTNHTYKARDTSSSPRGLLYDFTLSVNRQGQFFIHVPFHSENQGVEEGVKNRTACAVDPGVRTFLTSWDPNGNSLKIGNGAVQRLMRLCLSLDKLIAKKDETKKLRRRRRMTLAADRIRCKIKDLVRELHWKAADVLCKQYHTILLPTFQTQHMVKRLERKIGSKTARKMVTLSHYSFQQRLLYRAQFSGVTVHLEAAQSLASISRNFEGLSPKVFQNKPKFWCEGARIRALL